MKEQECFGPVQGRIVEGSVVTDFVWIGYRTLLITTPFMQELASSNLKIGGAAQAFIERKGNSNLTLMEIQIETALRLDVSCLSRQAQDCLVCGRSPVRLKEGMLRLQDERLNTDLFRARGMATLIFATEAFRLFCLERQATNIRFEPATIV